jgi:hypothetical protein
MNENEEIEEVEEEDPFDRTLFQKPIMDDDCDDIYLESIKLIEDTNIVENMFLENKRFKFDEEKCSNNDDNINNVGIKQLSNKRNYFLNSDIKIRKKSYPKRK